MSELMASGLQLMLVGMGTVFFFLTTLVFATLGMSFIVQRISPQPLPTDSNAPSTSQEQEEIAAIAAALHLHQQKISK